MATAGGTAPEFWRGRRAFAFASRLTRIFRPVLGAVDPCRIRRRLRICPEIDCLRRYLPPAALAAAELRAAEIGVGADRVLVASGAISEEEYVAELARWLGIAVENFETTARAACPLADEQLIEALVVGALPLRRGRESLLVIVPRGLAARRLCGFIAAQPSCGRRMRLATPTQLENFVARVSPGVIGQRAATTPETQSRDFSSAPRRLRCSLAACIAAAASLALYVTPEILLIGIDVALALIFLGWTGLRLGSFAGLVFRSQPGAALADDRLPVYTVIVALYREGAAVRGLIEALAAFDYPPEKLDLKLVIEPDDEETRAALLALNLRPPFEIIAASSLGPRTKPKALNAALPFVRGMFVTVYDAEDRPEPDQLRVALGAFYEHDERLACVQARLTIDNTDDSWLTRLFTAEYAGLFDVFLPGIAAWQLPMPLGGSSNHFHTATLRKIGAWDPYNVTEDADLGIRLARLGYRTAMIDSTTYEEAPSRLGPWLKQRTRWFKGWMQTWLVHMRRPVGLFRDLGLAGFVVFQLVIGGSVLAALVHLIFALSLIWQFTFGTSFEQPDHILDVIMAGLHGTILVAGYAISGLLGVVGLSRRGLIRYGWWLLLTPVYWLLLSLAAWRALYQLIYNPYHWEKTEHGLARTSRLGSLNPRERFEKTKFRSNGAGRWPPLRGAA